MNRNGTRYRYDQKLIGTELHSAINATVTNSNEVSCMAQQSPKILVDNQVVCNAIASRVKAICVSVNIHS
jgi:hypothetical protein